VSRANPQSGREDIAVAAPLKDSSNQALAPARGQWHGRGRALLLVGMLAAGAGSAAQTVSPSAADWQALEAKMGECTRIHGYDPAAAAAIPQHALGAGERAWRECVYAGIHVTLMGRSEAPEMYQQLIDTDRQMTDSVEQGALSRQERRQRLEEYVRNIRFSEEVNESLATAQEHERIRRDLERMRQQQEFERLVRPRIVVPLGR
jgi:hypothetical protein